VTHLVYLPHWYWQSIGSPPLKPLADRGAVLVSSAYSLYTDLSSGTGWQGYGGMIPQVWQYTDRLSFHGSDVDFNAFRGSHPGDQSTAAVAATLAEYKSVCETGKLPVKPPPLPVTPAKPGSRSASGKESLRHAAHREGTPVQRALWLMARDPKRPDGFGGAQRAYLAAADWDAIMPAGMVYWVG